MISLSWAIAKCLSPAQGEVTAHLLLFNTGTTAYTQAACPDNMESTSFPSIQFLVIKRRVNWEGSQ